VVKVHEAHILKFIGFGSVASA